MTNNDRLNFYIIKDEYIEYISQYDNHIAYNKGNKRPYIGIVLFIEQYLYFAPMFSPKPQHSKYKDNLSFFRMFGDKEKTDYLGLIRFADMIPVPTSEILQLNPKNNKSDYNMLLIKQYNYINKNENRDIIRKRAKELHEIVINGKKSKTTNFYRNLCCNFKILQEKSLLYK